jgi:glycosyltransferase involved in cell wall biosynthesis
VKIALVTRRYPPLIGGAERVLSYLAPALAAQGAAVVVVTSRPNLPPQPTPPSSVPVVHLPSPRIRMLGTWFYMRSLRTWFARNRIDIAYVSMLKHDAFVTVAAGKKFGFPVVLRPEGAGATGDLAWQSWGRFGRAIAKRCVQADAVVAISSAIESELLEAGYLREKIVPLPNGVPVPDHPWRPRDAWQAVPRAIFVGRLAAEKGLDVLVDAWPRVLESHPAARLTLMGEGPERPLLEHRIHRLGLTHAIRLPGASSSPEVELRDSDLFILPSCEEGMSIALLEAMALGIPLIASAIPGNRRLIDDGVHGRLFPSGDSAQLARAILESWSNLDQSAIMGANARNLVLTDYSITSMAKRHLELFQRLIPC